MPKLPKRCPACNSNLNITRLTCPDGGTEVTGKFPPDLFSRLAPNDFDFIVLFVKSKGNIKEMERELGISYWTIRTRLGELVAQLGLEVSEKFVRYSDNGSTLTAVNFPEVALPAHTGTHRLMHIQITGRRRDAHPALTDHLYCLKLELAAVLPSLHAVPPVR